jgi:hypothetical protein
MSGGCGGEDEMGGDRRGREPRRERGRERRCAPASPRVGDRHRRPGHADVHRRAEAGNPACGHALSRATFDFVRGGSTRVGGVTGGVAFEVLDVLSDGSYRLRVSR